MNWWHRWRMKVWTARYVEALGEIDIMDKSIKVNQVEYHDAVLRRTEAQSAISYHKSQLPADIPF